ncbi:OLC1v1031663C1 [Oldenlandia corymbosa var. corymbosa]|uniref:OLC1v1031663C1 n=1 Tax=Oldenlandia corymbosa var. corymbosa TaxID=529605 RepID=A0AAV1CLW0_OLDCO|nr:OLC1v1031663C1 [Oldenlandia corymbosa var. corymbosa]
MACIGLATKKMNVNSAFLRPSCQNAFLGTGTRSSSTIKAQKADDHYVKEDVVIVGAGIGGLATAVSLERLGIKSKVLEQADSLRTGGTSLTLSKNGWGALDVIGVGNQLRSHFLEIQWARIKSQQGKEMQFFNFKDADPSQEVRAVERKILVETLANQLPQDAISFSSKLASIEKQENGDTLLKLHDGSKVSAKVVVACDGIGSPVAKWMGFTEPKYAGYCAIRGLAIFPGGQPYEPGVEYIYGKGSRVGYVPVSPTKVYWFICFNSPYPGTESVDPSVLRQQSKKLVKNYPSELLKIIDETPDETMISTPIGDRWLWPVLTPSASSGKVVLLGDAWHPMTPNLGQGACCALEDAVFLSKRLAKALQSENPLSVEDAFRCYKNERWRRVFGMTIRAYIAGRVMQSESSLVCALRDNILVPKLAKPGSMLGHTNFKFEPLLTKET